MCEWGNTVMVNVKIPADLSCTGKEEWREKPIDSCIAPIVEALQKVGIDMRASCCGHHKGYGAIMLKDGRTLVIAGHKKRKGIFDKLIYRLVLWWISLFWNKRRSRWSSEGNSYYSEWEQRGRLIRNHRIYRLVRAR